MDSELSKALQLPSRIAPRQVSQYAQVIDIDGKTYHGPAVNDPFRAGALLLCANNSGEIYVSNGREWLLANPSLRGCYQYDPSVNIRVLPHRPYRRGKASTDEEEVLYNVSMDLLEHDGNAVINAHSPAFTGTLATKSKASIRYEFAEWPNPEGNRQYNFVRQGVPITRGELAFVIAQDIKNHIIKMKEHGTPLSIGNKEIMLFELVLISVKRVAEGSVQAVIGIKGH